MTFDINRRELVKALGAFGGAAAIGSLAAPSRAQGGPIRRYCKDFLCILPDMEISGAVADIAVASGEKFADQFRPSAADQVCCTVTGDDAVEKGKARSDPLSEFFVAGRH